MAESDNGAKIGRAVRLSAAFTPAAPVDRQTLFRGRLSQVIDCTNALYQKGMHIAVYGERGVGKTSLANVLPEIVNNAGARSGKLSAVRVDCNTNDHFDTLWTKVFREVKHDPAYALKSHDDPEFVRFELQSEGDRTQLIVLDEFDRLEDDDALTLLADTIKTLSDHAVPTTLMVVGVAKSLDDLLGEHLSIVRSITQVPMPRMSADELASIIDNALPTVPLSIHADARDMIVELAEGLPHYVHLLCLRSGEHAIEDDRSEIAVDDVTRAIRSLMQSHSLASEYRRATKSNQPTHLYGHVLLACAFASKNDLGCFRASDVRIPLSKIVGRSIDIPSFARHLDELSSDKRGYALVKEGSARRYEYRFSNPLLQPFVKMVSLAGGLVDRETLHQLSSEASVPQLPRSDDGWLARS